MEPDLATLLKDEPTAPPRESFPELPALPAPKIVFMKLRELRNSW